MGKLAAWGALAGLGKGMIANAEYQRKVDFAALEEAREMRLREYEAGQASARQQAGFSHDKTMLAEGKKWDVTMEATRQSGQTAQELLRQGYESTSREDTQSFTAAENKKKRESDEAQTRMQTDARKAAEGGESKRFEFDKVSAIIGKDAYGNPIAGTTPIIHDKPAGVSYVQAGDKFYLADEQGKAYKPSGRRAPPQKAIDDLFANPNLANDFVTKYGYLPLGWARAAQSAK